MSERTVELTVAESDAGRRLDAWLDSKIEDLSRSRIQSLVKSGYVRVEGRRQKCHFRVKGGLQVVVTVPVPVDTVAKPEEIPLDILYQDNCLLVINKPPDLVVHPAPAHPSGTLVNALLFACPDIVGVGGEIRPGIVHRLDKDTSGVMVVAKSGQVLDQLADQFRRGQVHKQYLAIVRGLPRPEHGTVETLVGRSLHDRKMMAVRSMDGKRAVTHYRVEEDLEGASLLRIRIETGRTHQIRVHMAHIGHPILGDLVYGSKKNKLCVEIDRQMLHASVLDFMHPATGKRIEFSADIPLDMKNVLTDLRYRKRKETEI